MPVHPTAVIDSRAEIHPTADIGAHVFIDANAVIGPYCRLAPGVVVYGGVTIGAGTRIHAHAVLGDVPQDRAFLGGESFVDIGENCVLREGVTVHRGTLPESRTCLGDNCFIMSNAHIGHNCVLEDEVTMISGSLLGGHVHVGARAVISGNAAVHQFVRIGELSMVSGLGKIVQDIPPFFMTDRDGALVGVNRVGLLRNGLTTQEREEIKSAFRILYRSGKTRLEAMKILADMIVTDAGKRLIDFLGGPSRRGLASDSHQQRQKYLGQLPEDPPAVRVA